ncbi:MAG: hypothetical protein A2W93_05850 [Bacteroidetes bacterium GWF2_43_63]|nr:MAG: hypothetical protein A2W94_04345 [Bacteroidetes bacterium GWE2_42_42]OFY55942.1 MAG: hypothetical protein A2W93_05850 [Bacteroidetes bacterium GWF2_43_63]HBG71510.1 hypothetical protein [Bacteroidales bacterium]HCB62982.1 hypothetical protein [Bacteroidales bacterium]HCY22271.1 hypothetical protein [Bacteroidales bacterium]
MAGVENKGLLAYNKQLDGLRCFAVLGVLILHFVRFDNIYISRIPFGQGVNLFFVISGFLITRILLLNKESMKAGKTSAGKILKSFYIRRTLRIFPIYYLTIFFLFAVNFQNTRDVFPWLVSYTVNIYHSLDLPYIGSFNHLWSLAVEEQFYLLWPFLMLIIPSKHIGKFIVFVIASSLAFKIYWFSNYGYTGVINSFTLSCADSLGFGALIAWWSVYKPDFSKRIGRMWYFIPLATIPFIYVVIYPRGNEDAAFVLNNFLYSLFAFFIVLRASQEKFSKPIAFILENPVVRHIGKISYGIYLYHFFMPDVYYYFNKYFPNRFPNEYEIQMPFYFIGALIIAQLSWMLIEKPILKFKDRLSETEKKKLQAKNNSI